MTQINFANLGPSSAETREADDDRPVESPGWSLPWGKRTTLTRSDLAEVSEQLAVMLDSGVRLAEAIETCREQADTDGQIHVADVLAEVSQAVNAGEPLSDALARQSGSFPSVYVALVRAGEKSGLMTSMIQRAVSYLRDEQEILQKVRGAMTYPIIMLCFALTTTVSLLTFVLPRFTKIYAGKEDKLPVPTKILMGMSDLMINYWFAIVPGTLLLAYGTWRWLKSEGGTAWWHSTQLRLPILGPMYRRLHLSRGLRMLGTLGGAGVGLVDCLDTARQLASNVWYQALWEDVAEQIRVGRPVSEPLRDSDLAGMLVPPSVVQMIRAGETGGKLSEVAEKVAGYAERELRQSVDQATRYIEPAMIVLMGGLIGGITMALLLPVFTVGRVIGQG